MAASAESGLQVSDSEKEFLECGLCYENDDLKRLPCSPVHIYCVPCLTRDSADTNIIQCPACRKVFDGGVNAIPSVSVTLDRMMCCDVCMRKEEKLKLAQMYCVICQKRFCDLHMKSHNDALDDHRRIPMSEYQREYRRLEIRYCEHHSVQVYSAACIKCYHVFCAECMIKPTKCPDGSTHDLASLSSMVAELSDSINQKKVWIFDKEEALLGIIKRVNGRILKWDEETQKMISDMHQARDKHLEEIRVRYTELENHLIELRSQGKEELTKFVGGDFDRRLNLISRGVKKLDFRLLSQHSVDIIKGFKDTEKLVQELMSIKVPNLPRPSGDVRLAPKDIAHDVALEVVELMNIKVPHLARTSGTLRLAPKDIAYGVALEVGDEIFLSTTSTVPIPTSMRLTKEIMVDDYPKAVFHHKTYTYVGVFGLGGSKLLRVPDGQLTADLSSVEPENIAGLIVHQNELLVLEDSSVQVKAVDLTSIRSWRTYFSIHFFNKIRAVDDRLVIPNARDAKLYVYDFNGKLLKKVTCSFCKGQLAMASVGDNSVVLSQSYANTVARVDIDTGEVLWTSDHVQEPQGVVCYKEKYVLVTNKNNCSRIWILDVETGELLGELSDKIMKESDAIDMHISGDTLIIPKYHKYYHHAHSHHNKGGTPHSPLHPSMGAVPTFPFHSSRNYSKPPTTPTSHVPPHIVKPQPTSAFKVPNQMTSSAYNSTGSPVHQVGGGYNTPTLGVESPGAVRASSLRRPSRQASQSPTSNNMNNLSASREDLKNSMMTQSTEQLSAEMAHLDCIMQDLNAIKTEFEMT